MNLTFISYRLRFNEKKPTIRISTKTVQTIFNYEQVLRSISSIILTKKKECVIVSLIDKVQIYLDCREFPTVTASRLEFRFLHDKRLIKHH